MNKSEWSHYQVDVKIQKYIKETLRYCILFPYGVKSDSELLCYSDYDWCGDKVDIRGTSGTFLSIYEVSFLGTSRCNKWLHCQPVKLSTLQVVCLLVKLFKL